jgi:hypothetical protein
MSSEQPKEYIITEFQLKQLQDFASLEFVCQAIRTRPHPAPSDDSDMVISMLEEEVRRLTELEMQADQRINKAREGVLDALGDDMTFLPSSEDSHGVVWVTLRHVQDAINERKGESPRSKVSIAFRYFELAMVYQREREYKHSKLKREIERIEFLRLKGDP